MYSNNKVRLKSIKSPNIFVLDIREADFVIFSWFNDLNNIMVYWSILRLYLILQKTCHVAPIFLISPETNKNFGKDQ